MIQKAKSFGISEPDFGKIHGHTKIILTNVKDGSQQVIEHDNTFQSNVIARQLRGFGAANASPWDNSTWASNPVWRNLVGGILLFRDSIDTTGGDVPYMPAGNQMTANGAYNVVNSDTPVEMGSYNAIESATDGANSITFVYDWGTSQGNGTISCVCLTSETGGYIGYGNPSGTSLATKRSLWTNQSSGNFKECLAYNGYRYIVEAYDRTNKTVTISKRIDNMTVSSIFAKQDAVSTTYSFSDTVLQGSSYTDRIHVKQIGESKLAIVSGSNAKIANGSTVKILVFDADTNALTTLTVNNTSGSALTIVDGWSGATIRHHVHLNVDTDGAMYIGIEDTGGSTSSIAKFTSAGVFVEILGEHLGANRIATGALTPDVLMLRNVNSVMYVYGNEDDYLPTNGAVAGDETEVDYNEYLDCLVYHVDDSTNVNFYKNPLYLATINNLETPVTKDATQTMKVIYTLTQA